MVNAVALSLLYTLISANTVGYDESFVGTVSEVLEGDTLSVLLDGEPLVVRLVGIDAPDEGQAYFAESRDFLADLVRGSEVSIRIIDSDICGKFLGIVDLLDGRNLERLIVSSGNAWWYKVYAPDHKELRRLQVQAMRARLGLWSSRVPLAPWDHRGSSAPCTSTDSRIDLDTVYVEGSTYRYHKYGCTNLDRTVEVKTFEYVFTRDVEACQRCIGDSTAYLEARRDLVVEEEHSRKTEKDSTRLTIRGSGARPGLAVQQRILANQAAAGRRGAAYNEAVRANRDAARSTRNQLLTGVRRTDKSDWDRTTQSRETTGDTYWIWVPAP